MNELTMGPLPAKHKRERDKYGVFSAFRCGVRDCPEVLATEREGGYFLTKGYERSQAGYFAKTRRAARRSFEQREVAEVVVIAPAQNEIRSLQYDKEQRWTAEYRRRKRERDEQFPDPDPFAEPAVAVPSDEELAIDASLEADVSDLDEKQEAARDEIRVFKRLRNPFESVCVEHLPFVVKCGRCGRISRIKGAG